MTNETLRMQMLAGVITESEYKAKLNENLKFNQVEKDRKYFATTDFGIFKKGDEIFVDTIRNLGNEVVIELSNSKGKHDSIKGDLEDEVEVFDNTMKESLNENFVGIGAINNPFANRKKETYEDAFEHFLSQKYTLTEEIDEEQAETEESFEDVSLDEEMGDEMGKEELVEKIKNLGDFGLTGDEIEFNGLLITASTQEDEGGPYYFVYGEDDDSEDGIFSSTNPNEVAEFVLNY